MGAKGPATVEWRVVGTPAQPVIVLVIPGQLEPGEVTAIYREAGAQIESNGAKRIVCDLAAVEVPDAATIDALARLQLIAQRLGACIQLRHVSLRLQELLVLTGLRDVVGSPSGVGRETGRKTEEGEQLGGIEEEADPDDLILDDLEHLQ